MNGVAIASLFAAAAGFAGAIVAALKLNPERTNILINATKGAVIVQSGVIDDLQEQITDMRGRIRDQDGLQHQITELHASLDEITGRLSATALERDRLQLENDRLKTRVSHLEAVVRRAGLDPNTGGTP